MSSTIGEPITGLPEAESESPEQRHNFLTLAWYQIVLRVGWIFKTESVIVPAALDSLGANGWVRGFLPVLSRFGQSIPPLLIWPRIRQARLQKYWLVGSTMVMSLTFAAVAGIWLTGLSASGTTAQIVFLVLYALFFVATGIHQLVVSTLIGKLIPVRRRGYLMLVSYTRGAAFSIFLAWLLLQQWLRPGVVDFMPIFCVSAFCFFSSALIGFLLREPPAPSTTTGHRVAGGQIVTGLVETWLADRPFRRVMLIGGLFSMSLALFPHYQNLARTRLDAGFPDLLPWLIAQNAGVALFSIPLGWLADRFGYRMVLRCGLVLLALAPALALWFANGPGPGRSGFIVVYFLLGLTPVTMRVLSNFSLEFAAPVDHPRYLAALTMSMALPVILTSPFLGGMIDLWGFGPVFGIGIGCLMAAWCLSFSVSEPRHR